MIIPGVADRRRDAIALALLAAGVVVYGYAWLQMNAMQSGAWQAGAGAAQFAGVAHWDRLRMLSFAGLAIALGGVGTAIWAHLIAPRHPNSSNGQEDRS